MIDIEVGEKYNAYKEKFSAYYEHNLKPILKKNDTERRRYVLFFVVLLLMSLVFYPMLIYYIMQQDFTQNNSEVGVVLGLSCLVVLLLSGPIYIYKTKVKPDIMPEFARFFGDFSYQYESRLPDKLLQDSLLFGKYNKHTGDDFFCGTYNDVNITISEEHLLKLKKDFRNLDIKQNVFRGVCVLLEMNKNFTGRTIVLEDKGWMNIFNQVSNLQNVKLEDSRFEKYFEVYSDDQVESRYLLTTAFMERILKLRDLYEGKSIQFCFENNTLLIAIPTRQNMFEANSFFSSNLNKAKIDLVFDQFYTIFSIVDVLRLNQRIGM